MHILSGITFPYFSILLVAVAISYTPFPDKPNPNSTMPLALTGNLHYLWIDYSLVHAEWIWYGGVSKYFKMIPQT